jgi:hypothetical protein
VIDNITEVVALIQQQAAREMQIMNSTAIDRQSRDYCALDTEGMIRIWVFRGDL